MRSTVAAMLAFGMLRRAGPPRRTLGFAWFAAFAACSNPPTPPGSATGDVVARLTDAYRLLVDDDGAYVAGGNGTNGTGIVRVPLDGGKSTMMVVFNSFADEAMDDGTIYFTSPWGDGGSIARMPKDGGPAEVLVEGPAGRIALDDAYVYWQGQESFFRIPKTGGAAEPLASPHNLVLAFVVVGTSLVWAEMPLDAGPVPSSAIVLRAPKDGGAPEVLSTGAMTLTPLAADDGGVYWSESTLGSGTGTIVRFDVSAGTTRSVVTDESCAYLEKMVTDGKLIYWKDGVWNIDYAPTTGGPAAPLVRTSSDVPDMQVHGSTLYWLDYDYDAGVTNLRAVPTP